MGIFSKKQDKFRTLEPDEVFLDSRNIPGFERERFEGRLEHPLSLKTFWYLGASLFILGFIFIYKSFQLQIVDGKELRIRAEANRLRIQPLWPERGLILDRNGEVMADNEPAFRIVLNAGEIKDLNKDNEKLEKLKDDLGESLEIPAENFENAIGQARREKKVCCSALFLIGKMRKNSSGISSACLYQSNLSRRGIMLKKKLLLIF